MTDIFDAIGDVANIAGFPAPGHGIVVPPIPGLGDIGALVAAKVAEAIAAIPPAALTPGYEIGDVRPWFTSTVPTSWLAMEGQSTAAMHATIVSMYGANLPDMRDRTLIGASGTKAIGTATGAESVTLTTTELPGHNHAGPSHAHAGTAHVHAGPSHTHSGPAHVHGQNVTDGTGGSAVRNDYNSPDAAGLAYPQGTDTGSSGTGPTGSGGTGDTGSSGTGATSASGTDPTSTTGTGSAFSIIPKHRAGYFIVKVS